MPAIEMNILRGRYVGIFDLFTQVTHIVITEITVNRFHTSEAQRGRKAKFSSTPSFICLIGSRKFPWAKPLPMIRAMVMSTPIHNNTLILPIVSMASV